MSKRRPSGTRARGFGYLCLVFAGASIIAFPSPAYDSLAWLSVTVGGLMLSIPAVFAAAGVLGHRYRLEWVALPALVIGMCLYAALAWGGALAEADANRLPGAFALTAFAAVLISRFLQLSHDDRRARIVVRARKAVRDARSAH